jgi:O-antigen/teichoic acid export membrane protein
MRGPFRRRGGEVGMARRVVKAGLWAFVMRVTIRASQLIRTVILARLLLPDDFGLMGIAVITLLFLEMLSKTGFRNALVQMEGDAEEYMDTAWTVEVIRGAAMAALVAVGAPLVGAFFGSPEVVPIVRVMALTALLNGLTNIAIVRFDRNLEFSRVFRFEVAQRVTEVVVAIAAAFVVRSVWALVIGAVVGSVARVIASFLLAPRRPRLHIDRRQAKEMYSYGRWIYGTNLADYFGGELDDILVGRIAGTGPLGLYRMAYTLSQSVVTEIAQTTNQVVFPAFARLKAAGGDVVGGLLHSAHFVSFLAMPMAMSFVVAGHGIVQVLLGDNWLETVVPLAVLAVAGAVFAVVAVVATLFEGIGRPEVATWSSLARVVGLAVVIYPAVSRWGLVGASWAVLLANVLSVIPLLRPTRQYTGERFRDLVVAVAWPIAISAVAGVLLHGFIGAIGGIGTFGELALAAVVAVVAYLALVAVAGRWLGYRQPGAILQRLRNR